MILRKLSIFGFKSFADKSELEFGTGITAIVGPNGCGKSNVVDAIRWVFGEQKPTALRSTNMQDVIFSGTQSRSPLNFAEVTLTIENNRHILPIEFNEVAITRRVYRNGETEYRINKTPCRLRDIHNLFLDTGVGSNTYTTIENNMINAILSDKAEERRTLFEEAAGVGKYKQRRKETQRKLEQTRLDLGRINEKVQDRDRDVRALARQVEKANRFRKWYDDLKSLELHHEHQMYHVLKNAMTTRGAQIEHMSMALETAKGKIGTAESQIEKMNLTVMEKENEVQIASRKVSEINEKIIGIDKETSLAQESIRHLSENIARYDEESKNLESQIAEKRDLRMRIERSKIESETGLQKHEEELVVIQDELAIYDRTISEKKDKANELSQEQISLINAIGEQRAQLSTVQNRLRNVLDMKERHEQEIELLTNKGEECREKLDSCKRQLDIVCEEHRNLLTSRETLLARIEREDSRYQDLFKREKQLEAQVDSLTSQLEFLKGLDSQFEGYEQGVKTLLKNPSIKNLGIVADLIRVADDKMTDIVDRIMGSELQTVVFENDADLAEAVHFLSSQKGGAARMVSLERIGRIPARSGSVPTGSCTPLQTAIETKNEHALLAQHLFGHIYVATSDEEALSASSASTDASIFASVNGVICQPNGMVTAGTAHKENTGIFMRKKKIESLPAQIDALSREFSRVVSEKENCIVTRDEAKVALSEVNEKLSTGQRRQQEQETNIKHYLSELENIGERITSLTTALEQVLTIIGGHETEAHASQEALDNLQTEQTVLERLVDEARSMVAEMEQGRADILERFTESQLRIQGAKHKITQNTLDISNLGRDIEHLESRKQRLYTEQQTASSRIAEMDSRIANLTEVLEKYKTERDEAMVLLATIREEYNALLNQIEEIRTVVKTDRVGMDQLSSTLFTLQNEQARSEEKLRAIRERMFEAYKTDMEDAELAVPKLDIQENEIEESIRMYKERISHLNGQVNMAAPEEYEQKNAELTELIKQRDDLTNAVNDLDQAIKKLNKEARQKFIDTFEQVKKNFSDMFTSLFEGGEVSLSLEENVDPLEAAIHINARPAGKKMRGVGLLSGGERALTAISLLFALYMVKPSAYCILDELDAPLDEANVQRFLGVLRKFSEQTQFIVITHNKRTMEAADVLYGVTQQERGISTIVSVRVEEAMRHAA